MPPLNLEKVRCKEQTSRQRTLALLNFMLPRKLTLNHVFFVVVVLISLSEKSCESSTGKVEAGRFHTFVTLRLVSRFREIHG